MVRRREASGPPAMGLSVRGETYMWPIVACGAVQAVGGS